MLTGYARAGILRLKNYFTVTKIYSIWRQNLTRHFGNILQHMIYRDNLDQIEVKRAYKRVEPEVSLTKKGLHRVCNEPLILIIEKSTEEFNRFVYFCATPVSLATFATAAATAACARLSQA